MSKKSRRRNKKILAALALAGGAAMLGKRGVAQGVSGADKAAFTSDAAYKLPSQAAVAADIAKDVVPNKSSFKPRIYPGTLLNERAALPGAGVKAPPGILNPYNPRRHVGRGVFKGGGIAKRGTGVALKHGGRVKSMGIAKRGGGVAKK